MQVQTEYQAGLEHFYQPRAYRRIAYSSENYINICL